MTDTVQRMSIGELSSGSRLRDVGFTASASAVLLAARSSESHAQALWPCNGLPSRTNWALA